MSYQDIRGAYYSGASKKHGKRSSHKRSILSSMDSIPYVDADGSSAYSGGGTSYMCDTSSSEALDSSGPYYPLHPLQRASSRQPLVETDDSSLNNLLDALDALDDRVSAAFSHLESLLPDSTSGDISGGSRNSLDTKEDEEEVDGRGVGATSGIKNDSSFVEEDSKICPTRQSLLPKPTPGKLDLEKMEIPSQPANQHRIVNNVVISPSWINTKVRLLIVFIFVWKRAG